MKQAILKENANDKMIEVFLIHASDEMQANVLESFLSSYGIPVLKKRREAGGYLSITMGMNSYGVDFYVPSKLHKTAVELINGMKVHSERDTELQEESESFRWKRLKRVWIIIAIFYFPVLIWLVLRAFQ